MAIKGRAQKGSRISLTRDIKMTNYSYKYDGGKLEGHLHLQCIVGLHKSVMRCRLVEYRSTKSEPKKITSPINRTNKIDLN